jgi:hypothetical protein
MTAHVQPSERPCPECSHAPTLVQNCWKGCCNGYYDLHREAPLYYPHGYTEVCHGCWGKGFCTWCPECGCDISRRDYLERRKQKAAEQ